MDPNLTSVWTLNTHLLVSLNATTRWGIQRLRDSHVCRLLAGGGIFSVRLCCSPFPWPLPLTPSPPSLCSLLATSSFFMLWHQTTMHCTVCSLVAVSMAIKTDSAPYSNWTGNQRHLGPICALSSDIMEFLGLESERSLALRIAAVPPGKDTIRAVGAPRADSGTETGGT